MNRLATSGRQVNRRMLLPIRFHLRLQPFRRPVLLWLKDAGGGLFVVLGRKRSKKLMQFGPESSAKCLRIRGGIRRPHRSRGALDGASLNRALETLPLLQKARVHL